LEPLFRKSLSPLGCDTSSARQSYTSIFNILSALQLNPNDKEIQILPKDFCFITDIGQINHKKGEEDHIGNEFFFIQNSLLNNN
jgi:hypothetical protein